MKPGTTTNTAHTVFESSTPWPLIFLLVGAGIVASFQIGKVPPAIPALREDLGIDLVTAGWVLSSFNVLGLAIASLAGAAADSLGHRRLLLYGLFCQAVASLAGALAFNAFFLLLTRFVEGLGFVLMAVSVPSLIVRLTNPRDLKLAFGIWATYMPAGTSAMMLLSPLIASTIGWRGSWAANGLLLSCYALCLFTFTRKMPKTAKSGGFSVRGFIEDLRLCAATPGPLLLALAFGSYALQFLVLAGFLPTLLMEDWGYGAIKASALSALVVLINVPGNLIGGWLLAKGIARWKLMAIVSFSMGLFAFGIFDSGLQITYRYLLCLLFSLSGGLIPTAILAGTPVHAPDTGLVSTTNGLVMQGTQLGQVVGPPLAAFFIARQGGWEGAVWLMASSAALCLMLSLGIGYVENKAKTDRR